MTGDLRAKSLPGVKIEARIDLSPEIAAR